MIEISESEYKEMQKHFPRLEVHRSKHKIFMVTGNGDILRELYAIRGKKPPIQHLQRQGGVTFDRPKARWDNVRNRFGGA